MALGLGLSGLELMKRNAQRRRELPVEGLAAGPFRGVEHGVHGVAVPRFVLGLAAHDHDVPRSALCCLDGAKRLAVADLGDARDGHERAERALGARRLEKAARLRERISAARALRALYDPDGDLRQIGLPRGVWQEARRHGDAARRHRDAARRSLELD